MIRFYFILIYLIFIKLECFAFCKNNVINYGDLNTGYKPLMKEYTHLKQHPSKCGMGFPEIHIHIMNIKGWLRGIHHKCSKERLQGYLNEYHFKYNRRNNMDTIFDLLINRMVKNEPIRLYKPI